ncbi:MAG: glycosyltransferase, partial [Flavobacteriia bacterium]
MNRSYTSFKLSIVVPTFNEDGNIEPLYLSLLLQMEKLHVSNFEIIYVNDGSSDGSLE